MGYQGYQGYGPKADIAQLLIQQQAAQANGMKGGPMAAGANLGAIPDIGSAEQQAGSSRKIADLLMNRAMSRNQQGDVVNWGTGLGQLGEALLARNANKKADSAEAKFATAESDKRQQIAQLLASASKASPEQQALLQAGVGMDAAAEQAFAPPPTTKYGLDLKEVIGPDGKPMLVQASEAGGVRPVEGMAPYQEPQGPMSTMGKLAADLEAGRITPQQYQIEIDRMQKSDPGLDIQFGEGGALSGITYGSSNKGKDPALVRTPDNTAAVSPGEQQARYNKVLATNKTLDVSDEVVAEDLDRAIGMAGAWTTGFVGAKLEDLQGTPAHDLKMLMQSIKANIGFDKLQQMRDNSPTGGALGQVTELELGLLQSVYGALEQSQTKEQFVYNLERLKKIKQKFADLRAEAFAMDYPDIATTGEFRSNAKEQVSDWNDADEARLRELEARMGAQ